MSPKERLKWQFLTLLRALLAILDLIGIMAIGFVVTSTAIFLTNGSDPDRVLEFAGLSFPAANAQSLPYFAIGILTLFFSKAVLSVLLTKKAAFFVARIEARAAKRITEIVLGSDLETARAKSREELMYAVQESSPSAFNRLLNSVGTFVAEGALFTLIIIGFFFIDPLATFSAVIYFSFVGWLIQLFVGKLMKESGDRLAYSSVQANTALNDLTSVFRELTVLGKRGQFVNRVYEARMGASRAIATQIYLSGMPRHIIEGALLIGLALFILAQTLAGDLIESAGTIGVFLSGGFRLTASMLPLQNALLSVKNEIAIARRAHEILSENQTLSTAGKMQAKDKKPASNSKAVGFEALNASFVYGNSQSPALDSISLRVEPGQLVSFIGSSGAGKSTIADLVCGIISPTQGTVNLLVDGEATSPTLRGLVSYVPQKPGLVSGSIAANVALAVSPSDVDAEKVWSALSMAHLDHVVEALPSGINTDLGKMMDGLSGGQIQRLGLARALYSDPGLLVMDEATSALDAESEEEINKALRDLRGKVTIALIAHRLNTVQHSDKVFLLDSGKLADSGTFQELVSRNSTVQRFVELMRIDEP